MKVKIIFLVVIFLLTVLSYGQDMQNEPKVVKYVDLKKYAGLWYEIAKIPNRFQKHCKSGTTAQYKLLENGKIEVINSCIEEDGERDASEGIAQVVDGSIECKIGSQLCQHFRNQSFLGRLLDNWIR